MWGGEYISGCVLLYTINHKLNDFLQLSDGIRINAVKKQLTDMYLRNLRHSRVELGVEGDGFADLNGAGQEPLRLVFLQDSWYCAAGVHVNSKNITIIFPPSLHNALCILCCDVQFQGTKRKKK